MERLTLLDFFLRDLQDVFEEARRNPGQSAEPFEIAKAAVRLDEILAEGGSIWRQTFQPYWSLVRRANETTQAQVERAASSYGRRTKDRVRVACVL